MRKIPQDPLFIFLLIASLIFISEHLINDRLPEEKIHINPTTYATVIAYEEQLRGQALDEQQKKQAITQYIHDEIVLKEAYRLGLHHDHGIRQKLLSKYRYILAQDIPAPNEQQLLQYYENNKEQFRDDQQRDIDLFVFEQPLPDAIKQRQFGDGRTLPFLSQLPPYQYRYIQQVTPPSLMRTTSHQLSREAFVTHINQWKGPIDIDSRYYYFRVRQSIDGDIPPYQHVQKYVREHWYKAQEELVVQQNLAALIPLYDIQIAEPVP